MLKEYVRIIQRTVENKYCREIKGEGLMNRDGSMKKI